MEPELTRRERRRLVLNGLCAPILLLAMGAMYVWEQIVDHPLAVARMVAIVLAVGLVIGAALTEFFSDGWRMNIFLVLFFAGMYFFFQVFPWGSFYYLAYWGGLISGMNFGFLSPKRFIIR